MSRVAEDRPWRYSTTVLLAFGLAVMTAHAAYRYAYTWSPFQRLYLWHYVHSRAAGLVSTAADYRVLHVASKRGSRLALPAEVELSASGEPTMNPTPLGREAGALRVAWVKQRYEHRWLHDVLRDVVYDGQRLIDLVRPSLWILPSALVAFLAGNLIADLGLAHWRRRVRRFRGPALVSARTFNRRLRTTGFAIAQRPDWLARRRGQPLALRLPMELESRHILVMGDAGSGVAAFIGQLLEQIRARGDTAIVYDPACAHVGRFYDAARGDILLNPLDARATCWSPADEIQTSADALALAAALVPAHCDEQPLITDTARLILAKLLTHRPTAQALAEWLTDRDERARRLDGARVEVLTRPELGYSAGRTEARLEGIRDALRLLPTPDEASGRWSARTWAAQRNGWLFLTAPPTGRDSVRPLMTAWLDTVLRSLQTMPEARGQRVWVVLDGVETVGRLTHLQATLAQSTATNVTVVVACQSRSEMDAVYGPAAEAILAQPALKVFFRTAEPKAAQWASDVIGRVDVERLQDRVWPFTAPPARGRELVPLLLPTEIAALPPFHGYVQAYNLVARLDMSSESAPACHEPFVERPMSLEPPPVMARARVPGAATTETQPPAAVTVPDDEPFFQ